MNGNKPTVGIFGLTGCAGDQLVILNCEDEFLDLFRVLDVRDFLMASSDNDTRADLDIALVEGAVLSRRDRDRLESIRGRSKLLVALGTCAAWGGVAAMKGAGPRSKLISDIYGEQGLAYDTAPPLALRDVVKVDLTLTGCPIDKREFLSAIAQLLNGDPPLSPETPVCWECRMREQNCLLIETGEICCGPVTASGCNARCPGLGIPCVGCRGPASDSNLRSAESLFVEKGISREAIARKLRTFSPAESLS